MTSCALSAATAASAWGFGGASLRRDVLRLAYACEVGGLAEAAAYWRQVVAVNEFQKGRFVRRVDSPAADVCRGLLADRARVTVYDPAVSEKQIRRDTAAARKGEQVVRVARDAYDAALGAHGVCVLTDWDEFRALDYREDIRRDAQAGVSLRWP
jgi:UDPglucose 6-dehydrogenase